MNTYPNRPDFNGGTRANPKEYNGVVSYYAVPGLKNDPLKLKPQNYNGELMDPSESNFKLFMSIVCNQMGIDIKEVTMRNKKGFAPLARQLFCKLSLSYIRTSKCEIGRFLSRDHTVVIDAVRRADRYISTNPDVRELYRKMELKIYKQ